MNEVQPLILLAATMSTGLTAGVFVLYAHTLMPGLKTTDDRTFVGAFQAIDRAIINPWFLGGCFLGAPILAVIAAIAYFGQPAFAWIAAALILYVIVIAITFAIHLPLNDAIKAAGDPDRITDLAAVRERFNEARWMRWNIVCALLSTTAFGCLAWSLVLSGHATT